MKSGEILATVILDASLSETCAIPRAAEISATSFNRVGNAPRVQRRGIVSRRTTRGALPTRLNESVPDRAKYSRYFAHFLLRNVRTTLTNTPVRTDRNHSDRNQTEKAFS